MVRSTSELSNATWWTPRADEPGRSVVERRYLERIRSRSASIAARSRSVIEETVLRGGGDVISPFGEKPRYWLNAEWFDADQSDRGRPITHRRVRAQRLWRGRSARTCLLYTSDAADE